MAAENNEFSMIVASDQAGLRLDVYLARQLTQCSRAAAAGMIQRACVQVNRQPARPARRLQPGDHVAGRIPEPPPCYYTPEALPLTVLYEDEALLLINKAPGMVVHPAPGNTSGTLVNALLFYLQKPELEGFGPDRPGIVHRLDKDTSGVMVVAKTMAVCNELMHQFKTRRVIKHYTALVHGRMARQRGVIEAPLGRHPVERKRMSVNSRNGRAACTLWQVQNFFEQPQVTLLDIQPATGRTHQIRVHLAAQQHPLLGDAVYGSRARDQRLIQRLIQQHLGQHIELVAPLLTRQMLHARRLGFTHPRTGMAVEFEAPLPEDMQTVITQLNFPQKC